MNADVFDVDAVSPRTFVRALRRRGAVHVRSVALPPALAHAVLADTAAFFALPPAVKARLDIATSPHFRGYSVMQGERDFREQMHFGSEEPAAAGGPDWLRLRGPNQWPPGTGVRDHVRAWLHAIEGVARTCLGHVAAVFGLPALLAPAASPYLLLKWIRYLPQVAAAPRPGVAAHLDFSLLTLTLQDDLGGLEVRGRDGEWRAVAPRPGTLLVHVGELLQFVTGGRLSATPHRVVNRSGERARLSLPAFVCPDLAAELRPLLPPPLRGHRDGEHVHHVLAAEERAPFVFGPAEWRRKGLNVWCRVCVAGESRGAWE